MSDVYIEADGDRYTVDARGHAATVQLCAAISALLYTLLGWLKNADGVQLVTERMEPGNARLEWRGGEGSRIALEMTAIGFLQLQAGAKDYVKVTISADAGF